VSNGRTVETEGLDASNIKSSGKYVMVTKNHTCREINGFKKAYHCRKNLVKNKKKVM
jgi:hypothetical protein